MSCYKGKYHDELIANAALLSTNRKPILVAGEYTNTTLLPGDSDEDVKSNKVDSIKSNKLVIDELLSFHPLALQQLSGVIFFEGAFYKQRTTPYDTPFVDVMKKNGILVGIQLDQGTIYHLAERCQRYRNKGIRFAKWRAVFKIGCINEPSQLAINENVKGLARFAITCQVNGLVPIIEPVILVDGSHDIKRCAEVTEMVFAACYKALKGHHVLLEAASVSAEDIAEYTARALLLTVPKAVPAVVFLCGGQSEAEAMLTLNGLSKSVSKSEMPWVDNKCPWLLSRSFGSTVQDGSLTSSLRTWCIIARADEP
ncbi:hypothetical protein MKW94_025187 [Papaver nudicaule]|uniref:fructose-bisphosphate aldolase n=1 Tax=Papaver nudicaule TaxID=74823 RepID=A0AA41V340_PAPNU|nr:hypothetical protein [Papaver nudicaule]